MYLYYIRHYSGELKHEIKFTYNSKFLLCIILLLINPKMPSFKNYIFVNILCPEDFVKEIF